jgi:hypothetical protein
MGIREKRNAHRFLVENAERKITQGRHRCKWENNIKIYLRIIRSGGMQLMWVRLWADGRLFCKGP